MVYLWILLCVAAAALIAVFVFFSNSCLKITKYCVQLKCAESKLRIVHLSDLHGKRFGKGNVRLINKVAALSPDLIAITGDIIHRYTPKNREVALELISSLKEISPVLFVAGNHELRNKGYRFFRKELNEAGAIVLDDRTITLKGISVTGLKASSLKNDRIDNIKTQGNVKVLLAHEPQFFEKYAAAGYDVVLCGHAHGGQWRIPFTDIGFYAPGQGLFPKLTSGMHKLNKTNMIISRGLGNSECPLRLFNRPEIIVVDIGE